MSGHSKWSTIKRAKEKNDQQTAKVFTKIGREITVAVKLGGADVNSNPRLKLIIQKAKSANMPNDNINRSIKRASGDGNNVNYETISYEGYGPAGSAVIVNALTDNKNRTAGDVRHSFDKFGGSLGSTGCVSYMFKLKGTIVVEKGMGVSDDDIMMIALESGAEDIEVFDTHIQITTMPEDLEKVKNDLEQNNITIAQAETEMIPDNYVELDEKKMASFIKLIDSLNDNDDIQEVFHNVENYEE